MHVESGRGSPAKPAGLGRKALRYGAIGTAIWLGLMAFVGTMSWVVVSKGGALNWPFGLDYRGFRQRGGG
jgi:hypothetical protein